MTKNVEQEVFDCGLQLGRLLEPSDNIRHQDSSTLLLTDLVRDLLSVVENIESLLVRISPVREVHNHRVSLDGQEPRFTAALLLKLTATGIKLDACTAVYDLSQRLTRRSVATSSDTLPAVDDLPQSTAPTFRSTREAAIDVINAISTCQDSRIGQLAAARVMLCLRSALHYFQASDPEYERATCLLERFAEQGQPFTRFSKRTEACKKATT